ncbi:unnamed protein product [Phaedon cochleariae]|uniref:Uncharacterized protein n=1 Tax=Phaedon cochleariae TaxID=80249 RepID=A0A9N9SM24_PHACE|nr:unnamed protein product [Phaedon cochleariae]
MLQREIQKIQNLYKSSIDDYEKLRFIHCSTVHDYSSLKEIYRKIEAENRRLLEEKKTLSTQLDTLQTLQKQLGLNKKENGQQNAIDDFTHIENIMQTQNHSLKLLLSNFLEDLKNTKYEDCANKSCQANHTSVGTSELIDDSIDNIDNLRVEVEKLRQENKNIRENLTAKQEHLSKCLEVLEKNHLDIGNLSTHIENICCERDRCIQAMNDKDEEIAKLKDKLTNYQKTSLDTEELKVEKERYHQENMKLKKVIDTYKSDNERKDDIIEKHDDEKEQLHDELGKFKRMSEQLQQEIVSRFPENNNTELEELKQTNDSLLEEIVRHLKKIEQLENDIANCKSINEPPLLDEHEHSNSMLIGERDRLLEEAKKLRYLLDNSDLKHLRQMNEQLQHELDQLKKHHNQCECDLEDKLCHLELTNVNLRDTLAIVTEENKSNLKAKDKLNDDLKKVQSDLEESENKVSIYKKEIDDRKSQKSGSCSRYSQYTPITTTPVLEDVEEKGKNENYITEYHLQIPQSPPVSVERNSRNNNCLEPIDINSTERGEETRKSIEGTQRPSLKVTRISGPIHHYTKHSCTLAYSPYLKTPTVPTTSVQENLSQNSDHPSEIRRSQNLRSVSSTPTKIANIEEYDDALKKLKEKIISLQHDLDEAKLEIAEYEEENKFYRQKLETLTNDLTASEKENSKLQKSNQESNERQSKMVQEFSHSATEKDDVIKQLKTEIDRLTRRKSDMSSYLDESEQSGGKNLAIENLKAEKTRLEQENEMLKTKLHELETALIDASNDTEKKVIILEKRIELLEEQDKKKQKRLENCCYEMDKIQTSLNADDVQKEHIDSDMLNLKNVNIAQAKEIDDLKNSIEEYKLMVNNCDCMDPEKNCDIREFEKVNEELKDRIKYLEEELNNKQCIIVNLEECIDNSNKILEDCEDEIKLIHQENERLKKDLEVLRRDLEEQTCESETHKTDKNLLEEEIAKTRRRSEELEEENSRLLNKNTEQKKIEDKIAQLQDEYNNLLKESKEKDVELEKITRQFEVLRGFFKQPNISREEFLKLKEVSQEIKSLVTDQSEGVDGRRKSSTYQTKIANTTNQTPPVDENNKRGNNDEVKCLQCKNEELSDQVADLKQFVEKVISDNNNLKLAITNLLNTVMNKIKFLTDSGDNLQTSTAGDKLATEVLCSLQKMEKTISQENEPVACTSSKCNCMDVIKSRYILPEDNPLSGQCIPCDGVCNKIMDARQIETIMDVRKIKSERQSTSRKSVPSCDSCCEGAIEQCCSEKFDNVVEKIVKKEDSDDDCANCTAPCAFNRLDQFQKNSTQ